MESSEPRIVHLMRIRRQLRTRISELEEGELKTQLQSEYEALTDEIEHTDISYSDVNNIVNSVKSRQNAAPDTLLKDAFETYMKQIYDIPITIPKFLIINGLKCDFITFQETEQMLHEGKIDRFIIDPMIQPWIGSPTSPNRIVTIFGKNGMTYLVIAKFNMQLNKVYAPVYERKGW